MLLRAHCLLLLLAAPVWTAPGRGMVAAQERRAAEAGAQVLREGGNAVDAPRFHHQWLPDRLSLERGRFPETTLKGLEARGHTIHQPDRQGAAEVIRLTADVPQGGADRNRSVESWVAEE